MVKADIKSDGTLSLPACQVVLYLRHLTAMEYRTFNSHALLLTVIVKQEESLFAEFYDGAEVTKGNTAHKQITQAPHQIERSHGTKEHHHHAVHDAKKKQPRFFIGKELYIHLAVRVVAYNAAERKHKDGYCHKHGTGGAYFVLQGGLRELYAIQTVIGEHAADDNHKCRAAAYQQRIGEHAERLHQTLFHRMGDIGRCRYIRSRTLACLVGKESALDAIHHCNTQSAAGKLPYT